MHKVYKVKARGEGPCAHEVFYVSAKCISGAASVAETIVPGLEVQRIESLGPLFCDQSPVSIKPDLFAPDEVES